MHCLIIGDTTILKIIVWRLNFSLTFYERFLTNTPSIYEFPNNIRRYSEYKSIDTYDTFIIKTF